MDEAHQVPDIAAQFFGVIWSVRKAQLLLRDVTAELSAAAIRAPVVVEAVLNAEAQLEGLRHALPRGAGRIEWSELPDAFLDALPLIETALSDLAAELEGLRRRRRHRELRAPCRELGQRTGRAPRVVR